MRSTIAVLTLTLLAAAFTPALPGRVGTALVSCVEQDAEVTGQPLTIHACESSATLATQAITTTAEPGDRQSFAVVSVTASHRRPVPTSAPGIGGRVRC